MSELLKTRSELLFLYDAKNSNPNGDPLDENKPRMDEERSVNLVTDVRLKRTVRDYLRDYKGFNGENNKDIFVKEVKTEKTDFIQTGKKRATNFGNSKDEIYINVIDKCIDVRLFGATIPLDKKGKKDGDDSEKGSSITLTGPVQFKMGRSLHPVQVNHIKGTGAFASGEGKEHAAFREEYFVMYSLIGFYGIINENAAKYTKLTNDDVTLLLDGVWNGTKNLISRSKIGQTPRMLLKIDYKEQNFLIGDLDSYLKIIVNENISTPEKIRDTDDYQVDLTGLVKILKQYQDKIDKINFKTDDRIFYSINGKQVKLIEALEGFNPVEMSL